MSAPTELDRGAVSRGLLVPRQIRAPSPQNTVLQKRRSGDPIATLSREHDELCREAVDRAEIAASLEAAGINDRTAREKYLVSSVFELADVLYELVPRRHCDQPAPRDPWSYPMSRHLGRGLLYALPMLPFLAALRVMAGSLSGVTTLLVGSVIAMAATHALSYVGYLMVGCGAPRSAARLLRRALLVTVVVGGSIAAWLTLSGLLATGPVAVAYAQLVYVVAATVLMVFERQRLLFFSLLPALGVSALALTVPELSPVARVVVAAGLVSCIVLSIASAWYVTHGFERGGTGPRMALVSQERRRACLHAAYGAVTAGLLMYAVLDALAHRNPAPTNTLVGIGMFPLIASLGISEWHLHAFRSDSERILHKTYELKAFARQVRRSLLRRILAYATILAALTVAVLAPMMMQHDLAPVMGLRHLGYALLGVALFEATLLVSCGLIVQSLLLFSVTLAVDTMVRQVLTALVPLTLAHAAVFAALMIALWIIAYRRLGSPLQFR